MNSSCNNSRVRTTSTYLTSVAPVSTYHLYNTYNLVRHVHLCVCHKERECVCVWRQTGDSTCSLTVYICATGWSKKKWKQFIDFLIVWKSFITSKLHAKSDKDWFTKGDKWQINLCYYGGNRQWTVNIKICFCLFCSHSF
jgi:hypothetical protein